MRTKKITIQLIIPEDDICQQDCEFCDYHIYDEEDECERCDKPNTKTDINLIWKIERYITNGKVITKTFARTINGYDDYEPMSDILTTEEDYQNTIKFLKQEGYEVINF